MTMTRKVLANVVKIAVVVDVLSHSSLPYIQKYLLAVDKRKQEAKDNLPELRLYTIFHSRKVLTVQ